ncbi:MAG: EI24 domain-containing protein [Rhodoferax sp.]|nr:EI24 domain-containing protein [Rhodoferax sp.]
MKLFLDSFWRAAMYCAHPRVMVLSLLPLVLMVGLTVGLGYFFWDAALDQVRVWMDSFAYTNLLWQWLEGAGAGKLKVVLGPLLVVFAVTPLIVVVSLLAVALLMTPALVSLVAGNRFAALEAKQGGSLGASLLWSLMSTALAALALVVSVPLWLIPPLVLVLPPLIWGWLTYRVMAFDALAQHASRDERRILFKRHSGWLLLMGVISGYLGASPSVVWAMGAGFAPAFIILVPVAIWIYMLVFAFASLWFTHYCLAALQALRAEPIEVVASAGSADMSEPPQRLNLAAVLPDAPALPSKDPP